MILVSQWAGKDIIAQLIPDDPFDTVHLTRWMIASHHPSDKLFVMLMVGEYIVLTKITNAARWFLNEDIRRRLSSNNGPLDFVAVGSSILLSKE